MFRSTRSYLALLSVLVIAACGSKVEDFAPSAIPETGIVDMSKIPAGNYKLVKIQSNAAQTEKKIVARFTHFLGTAGDPENGDETVRSVEGDASKSTLVVMLNVPYEVTASDTGLTFTNKHYYTHYARSEKEWSWRASGGEDLNGMHFYELYDAKLRASEEKPVYRQSESTAGSIQVEGNLVKFFAETSTTVDDVKAKVVVVLTYQKI